MLKSAELYVDTVFNQTFQADKSGDLDTVEVFKLEHYVAVVRREYMESCDRRNPSSITEAQMKKAVSSRSTASHLQQHTEHRTQPVCVRSLLSLSCRV